MFFKAVKNLHHRCPLTMLGLGLHVWIVIIDPCQQLYTTPLLTMVTLRYGS